MQRPDGTIERDYGAAPRGRLAIDAQGRYTLQIFKAERPRFASADKAAGTGDELRYRVPARPDGGMPISVWRRMP